MSKLLPIHTSSGKMQTNFLFLNNGNVQRQCGFLVGYYLSRF